jgi:hypothetical protein
MSGSKELNSNSLFPASGQNANTISDASKVCLAEESTQKLLLPEQLEKIDERVDKICSVLNKAQAGVQRDRLVQDILKCKQEIKKISEMLGNPAISRKAETVGGIARFIDTINAYLNELRDRAEDLMPGAGDEQEYRPTFGS